jgi:hypothetical protein
MTMGKSLDWDDNGKENGFVYSSSASVPEPGSLLLICAPVSVVFLVRRRCYQHQHPPSPVTVLAESARKRRPAAAPQPKQHFRKRFIASRWNIPALPCRAVPESPDPTGQNHTPALMSRSGVQMIRPHTGSVRGGSPARATHARGLPDGPLDATSFCSFGDCPGHPSPPTEDFLGKRAILMSDRAYFDNAYDLFDWLTTLHQRSARIGPPIFSPQAAPFDPANAAFPRSIPERTCGCVARPLPGRRAIHHGILPSRWASKTSPCREGNSRRPLPYPPGPMPSALSDH